MKDFKIGTFFTFLDDGAEGIIFRTGDGSFAWDAKDIPEIHAFIGQWLKENPKKVEGWLNCYEEGVNDVVYDSKKEADRCCSSDRLACIPISYHIGEGLDTTEGEDHE